MPQMPLSNSKISYLNLIKFLILDLYISLKLIFINLQVIPTFIVV